MFGLILISNFQGLRRNAVLLLVKVKSILPRRFLILDRFRSKNPVKSTCQVFRSFQHYRLGSFFSSFHKNSESCHELFFKGLVSPFHFGQKAISEPQQLHPYRKYQAYSQYILPNFGKAAIFQLYAWSIKNYFHFWKN